MNKRILRRSIIYGLVFILLAGIFIFRFSLQQQIKSTTRRPTTFPIIPISTITPVSYIDPTTTCGDGICGSNEGGYGCDPLPNGGGCGNYKYCPEDCVKFP